MALVVKAWHMGLDKQVAIKLLRDDVAIGADMITRFVREAQAAARLKGEHTARITDVGTFDDGRPYMVMEYLEGQDIGQLIAERGWLSPSLAIDLVIQACEALAEAHSLGIVHRDIKPTNLFLTSRPDGSVLLKVLDFGISKAPQGAELSLTQTWSLLGTPAYMSPEQMRSARHVDARTDLWSLGAVLYEALEGHLPFQADSFSEMCVMVAVDPFTPTIETPRILVPIISRCLAKLPDDRYPNVAELARDLAQFAREPDRAQVVVDRIHRMLGRSTRSRTPAVGVAQLVQAAAPGSRTAHPRLRPPATPAPVLYADETPRTGYRSPFGDLPNGFTPAHVATGTPASLDPGFSAPSLAVMHAPIPGFAPALPPPRSPESTPSSGLPASATDAPPYVDEAHRPGPRATPSGRYSAYPLVLPDPLHGDARYLQPGLQLPRGAPEELTKTQVIAKPFRPWLVILMTTALAVAAALTVIAIMSDGPEVARPGDVAPDFVQMRPTPGPIVSPIDPTPRDTAAPIEPTREDPGEPPAPAAPGDH
jgi:serine/threonine protein kinase